MKITEGQLRKVVRSVLISENMFSRLGAKLGFDSKEVNELLAFLKKSRN